MQSKFFQEKKKNKSVVLGDRDIPHRPTTPLAYELQSAIIEKNRFDINEQTPFSDYCCQTILNMSYKEVTKLSVRSITIPEIYHQKTQRAKIPYRLKQEESFSISDLSNNYYCNTLSWGTGSRVYIGSNNAIYLYNPLNRTQAHSLVHSPITAIAYSQPNYGILIGTERGGIEYIDSTTHTNIRFNHENAIYTKIVSDGDTGFYAGSKKTYCVAHIDLRTIHQQHQTVHSFDSTITGLAFDPSSGTLAVSNGTLVELFDHRYLTKPRLTFKHHNSPSKALNFSPYERNIIATGGGSDDKKIMIWNIQSGLVLAKANTSNQVCNIHWHSRGLFVTAGFNIPEVSYWSINGSKLSKDSSSTLHTGRVLFSAQNPADTSQIVTAAPGSDNTLRFWSVSNAKKTVNSHTDVPESFLATSTIR